LTSVSDAAVDQRQCPAVDKRQFDAAVDKRQRQRQLTMSVTLVVALGTPALAPVIVSV
jgi:hypothetical protein